MARNYKIDFANNTITITKEFERRAMNVNSKEYAILTKLKADFPNIHIIKNNYKRRNSLSRPSYDKMVKYISCQKKSAELLEAFNQIREVAKSQENPYQYVRTWFFQNFADYQSIPMVNNKDVNVARSVATEKNAIVNIESQKDVA